MSTIALAADYSRSEAKAAGDAFVDAVYVSLPLVALPIKNAAYIAPLVFIAMQWYSGNFAFVRRVLLWICLAVSLSTVSIMIDSFYGRGVSSPGVIWGVLTFASLAVMLSLRADFTISPARWQNLRIAVAWFVIAQSVLGMLQFAVSGIPDRVSGTFGLFDFRSGVTIAQVYLTFNLFAMVMFLLTDAAGLLSKIAIGLGLIACSLAHSGHQTMFLMASLALVGMLQLRIQDFAKLASVSLVVFGLTITVSSIYWEEVQRWYQKAAVAEESTKKMVTISAVEIMSTPKNILLGVGIGQFGSRAALIATGEYLSVALPDRLTGESEYYIDHIRPAEYVDKKTGEGSAISKPYYSALNLIVEFGVPLTLLLVFAASAQFYRNWQLTRSFDSHTRAVGLWANVGLVFLVLCSFIENYLEFPQAIFLPILLYVAAQTSTRTHE
jgi:hypothetical protein